MGESKRAQRRVEMAVLGLYGVYSIGVIANIRNNRWEDIAIVMIVAAWMLSAFVHLRRLRSYQFRTYFTALMIMGSMVVYGVIVPDLMTNLTTIITVVILLGLYGNLNIIGFSFFPISFLIVFHLLISKDIKAFSVGDWTLLAQQIFSVYLANYIVYYLVKKQLEINDRQSEIIRELKLAERSKDDFLANVSHEIRTPVNTVCGLSEIILRNNMEENIRKDVYSIQEAGRNITSIVSDILDFSELQSGKMQLEEVEYNIASTINDIIRMSFAKKENKKIDIIVDCSAKIPSRLSGDEQKIRRVIMNLIDNSIKFTTEGCIEIGISCRHTDRGINLMVTVTDTGIGVKEENLEKLFTSFSQADTKRNRQEGGLGLGLAISRVLVEEMGGFITLKSTFGKGTQVKFVIPQKVVDETPIVVLHKKEEWNVGVYLNLERSNMLESRESYLRTIEHMAKDLEIKSHICRSVAELKRKENREQFTHIFISMASYKDEEVYFDQLSKQTKVVVFLDEKEEREIDNPAILRIYKPFYVLSVATVLNDGEGLEQKMPYIRQNRFIAPQVHILVVDDNLMNIRVLEGLLEPYQIKVTKAVSGFEALEKIESMDYDFVFMDHMMPDMDGVETLQRIRKKKGNYYKNVPVIALTANAIAGMHRMFIEEGFQDFMAKPVELSVLERVLERNIPKNKIQKVETAAEVSEPETDKTESTELYLEDIDVKKGIQYCGGIENYIEVLRIQCEEGRNNQDKLQNYFTERDLNNYTILVHAIKSSSKSIGADRLSQIAKSLEAAGKAQDWEYITANHQELLKEQNRILNIIENHPLVYQREENENPSEEKDTLTEEEFDEFIKELEDEMYGLQKDNMLKILERMQEYSYGGQSLKKPLEQVKKKVEMLDFMSAVEVVRRLREHLRRKE